MGWDIDSESKGGEYGEKIPAGTDVPLTILSIKTAKPTKKGHRQIMVIFEDLGGCEGAGFFPLEGPARWRTAKLMKAVGYSKANMEAANLEPTQLLTKEIADSWLKGKTLFADVKHGEKYVEIDPKMPPGAEPAADPQPADALAPGSTFGQPAPKDDDIPF